MPSNQWQIGQTDKHCHSLKIRFHGVGKQRILILSDLHWDSAKCRLDELKAVLDQAKTENAPILLIGDTWDAMQGKYDPRASQDDLRPEFRGGNYLDRLVDEAFDWFQPYAKELALISYGNHETEIQKRHEVDLVQRFAGLMRRIGSPIMVGQYWGFVRLVHHFVARVVTTTRIHYHHGYGGGGEVTRGLIDWSRARGMYEADIFVSGHIHRRNLEENIITRLSSMGKVEQVRQLFLRSSCWKDESSGSGWHIQKGRAARPIGGWWLEIEMRASNGNRSVNVSPIMT